MNCQIVLQVPLHIKRSMKNSKNINRSITSYILTLKISAIKKWRKF
jgi:hypothetical protein